MPICLKGCPHLAHDFRHHLFRHLYIPLQPFADSGFGKIRRTHIGRRKACISVENVCLSMQTCFLDIVRNANFRIWQLTKLTNCFSLRRSHISCGDNSKLATLFSKATKLWQNYPQACPSDKGNQKIYPVRRIYFPG